MALARLSSGTKSAAIVAPMEKKIPCENAVIIRAISSSPKLVDKAATEFPTIKITINSINSDFLLILLVKAVNTGAPNATPIAYPEINNPASVMEIFKSSASDDNKPTGTNSVVPIPKALIASANSGKAPLFLLCCVCESVFTS
jgi:hypothetical protein